MSISPEAMHYLCDLLKRRSAILVDSRKDYLLESRLAPLVREAGLTTIDELAVALRRDENTPLTRRVVEAMTTNETSFFRDAHPWEALKTKLLPDVIHAREKERRLRIWCAAASTGQEPYTIAMIIREHFPALEAWNVQIVATDINAAVLERARSGVYRQLEVNRGLPPELLHKYFEPHGGDWRIKASLRRMVTFQELNLLDRWPLFSVQDIVFMRNVLIYFDVDTKKRILERTREHLDEHGYLVLGGAETTLNLDDQYVAVRAGRTTVYQRVRTPR